MKLLCLETSTRNFSLAVCDGERILAHRSVFLKSVLSSSIIPGVERILEKAGLSLGELDGFAVGLGPGSFTSLRVGLATVKGLAFATGKPVVGIPSLDALAMNVPGDDEKFSSICVICDARRNLVYACVYQQRRGFLRRKSPYLLTNIEGLLDIISGKVLFTGDGVRLFREEIIRKAQGGKFVPLFAPEKQWFPQAKHVASLALKRFSKRKKGDDINKLVPLYLYPHDCQVRGK